MKGEFDALATEAFVPSAVRDVPLIHPSRGAQSTQAKTATATQKASNPDDTRGDSLVRNFWRRGTDCIFDFTIVDLDAPSSRPAKPTTTLRNREAKKNRKYRADCREQRRDFTPFVASADGLLGSQAQALLKRLTALLAHKWARPHSQVMNYVRTRFSISLVRASHTCLRGSRIPASHISHP